MCSGYQSGSTGCKLAEQVRARTTCMEGEDFTASVIEEYTGYKAKPYIPMIRGGDQSFWGAHIPIDIMFKYEPVDEKKEFLPAQVEDHGGIQSRILWISWIMIFSTEMH